MSIKIDKHCSRFLKSNTYLLKEEKQVLLIDPTQGCLERFPGGLAPDYILLTHEHYDHINGVNEMKATFPACRVVCSAACAERICDPRGNASHYFEALCRLQAGDEAARTITAGAYACEADLTFEGNMTIAWQGHNLYLQELPGHSPGSICILVDDCLLFTGDTLLRDKPTITRFPGGSRNKLCEAAYPFFRRIPGGVKALPGHGDGFLMGEIPDLWSHMRLGMP